MRIRDGIRTCVWVGCGHGALAHVAIVETTGLRGLYGEVMSVCAHVAKYIKNLWGKEFPACRDVGIDMRTRGTMCRFRFAQSGVFLA